MTGPLSWESSAALPEFTDAPVYLLGIEAFADGGTTKWKRADAVIVKQATDNVLKAGDTMTGNLTLSNALLKVTKNGNTITIGAQNDAWCHFENSANIPFYFNKQVSVDGNLLPYGSYKYLGNSGNYWAGAYVSGPIISSFKSGTWINSVSNSAIVLQDAAGSYGGWICGPTKNGRIAISTYQSSDDMFYIGYAERGRTTNSFTRSMYWNAANGYLYAHSHQTISSRKHKKEIMPYEDSALEKINNTSIVSFKFNEDSEETDRHIGFIAEDTPEELAGSEHDRMDLNNCVGMLLKAVQELSEKVNKLEGKLN